MWRKRGAANDPKHTASSVRRGRGSVMALVRMAAPGTGSLLFTDDADGDDSSRENSLVQTYASKLAGRMFMLQRDNDTKEFSRKRKKRWDVRGWTSQSPHLNPIEHAFHMLKIKLKSEQPQNMQQLKEAAMKAWQSIPNEVIKSLGL